MKNTNKEENFSNNKNLQTEIEGQLTSQENSNFDNQILSEEDDIDLGWQESSKRDAFIKDIKQTLQELILRDYKSRFTVKDFPKFLNRLVDIIIKKF